MILRVVTLPCCNFHCILSTLQGFPVLQQRDPAVCHPLHGLRPLGGPQDSALPVRGGAAVAGGFVQYSGLRPSMHWCRVGGCEVESWNGLSFIVLHHW